MTRSDADYATALEKINAINTAKHRREHQYDDILRRPDGIQ